MTKQEVIELVKSGRLRGFLTPEAARYAINIEEMGHIQESSLLILI